eukprot:TRINITY_DN29502_c0_g1_i1.p1 TRINITY_DN29502_c0_g1~~TRINITY_DN29502_c0_g1_i1.p1  ORF type:complete len:234 (+),score=47.39 TRINITY_DN29502_c0_g1_i1:112-813(+)
MQMHPSCVCVSLGILLLTVTPSWTHIEAERREGRLDAAHMKVDEALTGTSEETEVEERMSNTSEQKAFEAVRFFSYEHVNDSALAPATLSDKSKQFYTRMFNDLVLEHENDLLDEHDVMVVMRPLVKTFKLADATRYIQKYGKDAKTLTLEGFLNMMAGVQTEAKMQMMEHFKRYDDDGDGLISEAQLETALQDLEKDADKVNLMFTRIDDSGASQGGKLALEKVVEAITQEG